MYRIYWPSTAFVDLPDAAAVERRLSAWVPRWFGSAASLDDAEIVSSPDLAQAVRLSSNDAACVAVCFSHSYLEHVASCYPALLTDETVLSAHVTDLLSDLCSDVFDANLQGLPASYTETAVPDDLLKLVIDTGDAETESVEIFVSADIYFGRVSPDESISEQTGVRQAVSDARVSLTVEKSFSMNVSGLVELSIDDFLPICDADDAAFSLAVSGEPIGAGYIGHVENKLAIVVEK